LSRSTPQSARRLADRELQVLRLVAEGDSTAEIVKKLFIAERTVKNHIHSATLLLGARNRAHAVAIAVSRGMIQVADVPLLPSGNAVNPDLVDRLAASVDRLGRELLAVGAELIAWRAGGPGE